jgi:hypothetical protein
MTVENLDSVDGMGISKADGKAVLTIADHLDWSDEQRHSKLLEKKIDAYLGFINSGQLQEALPVAKACAVRVEIIYQYEPNEAGSSFLRAAKRQLQDAGVELTYSALPSRY